MDINWSAIGAIAAVIVVATAAAYLLMQIFKKKDSAILTKQKVIRDWKPTGNINFIIPQELIGKYEDKSRLYLEIEEDRLIELVGGGETKEIRFRLASSQEAVVVVKCYNRHVKAYPTEGILGLANLKERESAAKADDRNPEQRVPEHEVGILPDPVTHDRP
jgi:hypothetical protein